MSNHFLAFWRFKTGKSTPFLGLNMTIRQQSSALRCAPPFPHWGPLRGARYAGKLCYRQEKEPLKCSLQVPENSPIPFVLDESSPAASPPRVHGNSVDHSRRTVQKQGRSMGYGQHWRGPVASPPWVHGTPTASSCEHDLKRVRTCPPYDWLEGVKEGAWG